ncbi:endonuclease/exonuclease/phosphatase family protein [Butyrivibrio sp. VCD2006]|uniref:endonuclease/exonuclease/phosphatase family protein n=1 Tax=Butyrivibrio sp. VCD2006 TaxID=1280664 RepID=UPI001FA7AD00|nr:endonuclease/exonuclease/phosphatase family protein [Butyrivibrio sp. VCD2006]
MKTLKKILIGLLIVILVPLLAYGLFMLFLTVVEYKPADVEDVKPVQNEAVLPGTDNSYTIMTWNIGFGALDENDDFFMDGGKDVRSNTAAEVDENIAGIRETIEQISPDFAILQEVDRNSDRSHRRDEVELITSGFSDFSSTFAYNYKVFYIPYPIPPIGKVEGGLLSFSRYNIESASRIALPCPFSWPERLGNLRRCLLVSRIPVGDVGKELVIVNLHLEAYDSGEGKAAQTALLKNYLENEISKGNYVVAGGDFNQTFSNIDTSAYPVFEGNWQPGKINAEDFSSNFQICMSNNSPSCRSLATPYVGADDSTFQFYVIDGFLVSKNVEIEDLQTIDCKFKYADHNPVVLKFKIVE